MNRLVATIVAVPSRMAFAENLLGLVAGAIGTQHARLVVSKPPFGLQAAAATLREALQWQKEQDADWNLFLEDDQVIYPGCFQALPRLMSLADEIGVDAFYLSNRKVAYAGQQVRRGFVVNRITQGVQGTHGLMYRRADLHRWAQVAQGSVSTPADILFFQAVAPQRETVLQVVSPILMQHVGGASTLHDYKNHEHLLLNEVETSKLWQIPQNL